MKVKQYILGKNFKALSCQSVKISYWSLRNVVQISKLIRDLDDIILEINKKIIVRANITLMICIFTYIRFVASRFFY